jgi:MFS family permease
MDDEKQWRLERPGAAAEEMFKDDPFMLEGVKKLRAEPDPVQKPWWWMALLLLAGFGLAGAMTAGMLAFGWRFHPLVALAGVTGGCFAFMGIVGHRPGTFQISGTEERLTLWKPTRGWQRAAFVAGGLAFAAAGPLLVILDASQKAAPAHRAKPHR